MSYLDIVSVIADILLTGIGTYIAVIQWRLEKRRKYERLYKDKVLKELLVESSGALARFESLVHTSRKFDEGARKHLLIYLNALVN